jgi:hypothetical protein
VQEPLTMLVQELLQGAKIGAEVGAGTGDSAEPGARS